MRTNKVKQMWRTGSPVAMGWCATPDPFTTEVMARAGFDALVLDMQHGMAIGPDRAATWLQIVGQTEVTPFVRIPWNEPVFAQQVLDAGAMGIIVPMVNTLADAVKAAGACRYPPVGYRSNGANRASFLGADYLTTANAEIACLVQIETVEAVKNIESMADVPGLDGYYIGPSDLAISMGIPSGQGRESPQHADAVQKVLGVAKKQGRVACIHVGGPEEAARRWRQGFVLSNLCTDVSLLGAACIQAVSEFRRAVQG
jgi:4-hydroxy-2-oxoheptanedioate aldolase